MEIKTDAGRGMFFMLIIFLFGFFLFVIDIFFLNTSVKLLLFIIMAWQVPTTLMLIALVRKSKLKFLNFWDN